MTTESTLDPILKTRLDLLEQAVDEVNGVISAMREQRSELNLVESCLAAGGHLDEGTKSARTALSDAEQRLRTVLDPGNTKLTANDRARVEETLEAVTKAQRIVAQLAADRQRADVSFQDVYRWSVAGLAEERLVTAANAYKRLVTTIRRAPDPWRRYEDELRGRGQELFTSYLELLGGMAVRGFGLDAEIMEDVAGLVKLLMPVDRSAQPGPALRSPLALLGTRHVQLGYPQWSLWALPLVGRTAGESMIESGAFATEIPTRLRVLCADMYALTVLGPSYAHAAIFLELDPEDAPQAPMRDAVRAELLLTKLPELDPGHDYLVRIAERLRDPWTKARRSFNQEDAVVAADDLALVDEFCEELRLDFPHIAYDPRWVADADELGIKLTDQRVSLDGLAPNPRDLTTAMWLARLRDPSKVAVIHERAKTLAAQKAGTGRTSEPTRVSRQRIGA